MIKQIIVEPQMISAYMQDRRRIPLTVMSFDVDVHELVIPVVGVEPNQITQVIAVFNLKRAKSTVQTFGEVKEDKVHIKLPIQLNRYKGRFGIEVDLRLAGNVTLTLAQFEAESRRSDIDANNVELLPYYFKLFDELVTEVQTKRADALEEITDETNDAIFDIGEQVRLTELAKTEAIQNIDDKVELVETTKKAALTDIGEQVESVESAKGLAIDSINDEKTLAINAVAQAGILAVGDVGAAQGSAIGAINGKVTNVDNAKKDAVTAIGEDVSAVSNLKTNALQSIADDTQSASDSLTTINGYQQTASDAVVAIDGHLANTTAKNEQVNQKYQEFDTTVSEANQNIQGILALQNDVNTLKNEAPVTNDRLVDLENRAIKQYGVRRTLNATSPLLERIGDSAGKIANVPLDDSVVQNDFDNIYPWSHIKEVIIDSEGRVHYKGEPTYETAIGDWMIEVPLYYAKDVRTETYHDEYVSAFKLPGYYTPKDFIREDGTVCQKVYYGRFKTSKEGNLDVSRPHELPSNYRHLASFRDGAKAKGDGWQEIGIDYVCDFLQRLYKIEFANLNSQAILGSGITSARYVATDVAILSETATNRFVTTPTIASNFRVGNVVSIGTTLGANNVASMRAITAINDIDATQAEILFDGVPVNIAVDHIIVMVAQKTGQTTHLNQPSGKLSGVSGRTSIKWRGLEDPFGNLHEWIDGVLIVDNVGHLCDEPSKFSSALTSDYAPVNYVNANTNGYQLELGFDNNYPSVKFPILTGAGTTTGYADYYYQTTGLRGAFLGGHATNGSFAGLFYWFLGDAPSYSPWFVGGRLLFKPQRQIKF